MGEGSALRLFLVGMLVVAAVAAATFGVVVALDLDDDDVDTVAPVVSGQTEEPAAEPEPELVLRDDQVEVTGVGTGITVEGATLDLVGTPLTVTVPARGGSAGATLTDVEVDGQLTDVVWDGGRPFDLRGDGGVIPLSVNLFAAPSAITIGFVDGAANQLEPGAYGLQTPVAIGRGGLARPQDSVAFEATVESTVVFRGGAATSILPRELSFEDGGRVLLQGTFEVRRPDGTTATATGVELPDGAFRLRATPLPDGGGYEVEALLQGPVSVV